MVVVRVLRLLEQAMDRAADEGVVQALEAKAGRFFREDQWTDRGDREKVMDAYGAFQAARKRAAEEPHRGGQEEPIP